ncbi:MAG: branched-chain amino acid transport system permease protein, partial [Solirubrobacterales bacterium]|nr:branched-chain amino acid transport system permease protein [Solirubrobacterales bacterium]
MSQFVQCVYSAFVLGSIYAAMAMGLSLVWGGLRMLNMAHGGLLMVGAYAAFFATDRFGVHPLIALVFAVLVGAGAGALMYPLIVRPLIGKPGWDINVIVATVALTIVLSQVIQLLIGPKTKALPKIVTGGFSGPADIFIEYQTLIIAGVALMTLLAMALFLRYSRLGLSVQAVAQNLEGAHLVGISIGRTNTLILAIGAGLAALSGVLLASGFVFLTPTMGTAPLLKALIIILLGGLGSIKGTVYAAYVAGLVESAVAVYLGATWSLPILFGVVIAILLIRPEGFFG